jgi:hypothetical protein
MTATREITIQGHSFQAPAPYAEGHVLTGVEPAVLNQCFGENLRNNFAGTVIAFRKDNGYGTTSTVDGKEVWTDSKAPLSPEHLEELRAGFAEYAKTYTFASGANRGPRGPQDPVKDMALSLAKARVSAQFAVKFPGQSLTKARLEELATKLYDSKTEEYRAKAEAEIKKASKGEDMGEDFFA